ncbi:MAG: flagellar hook-basal body complex protein FliE [Pseudomonadota bacterium]|jgi:flagellar hook-basal body complex protein FliE
MIRGVGGGIPGGAGLDALLGGGGAAGVGGASGAGTGGGFGEALDSAIRGVDAAQAEADAKLRGLATGENVDIHGTMIALEEANISLRTMGSVRDKVVEAWQALWHMPV